MQTAHRPQQVIDGTGLRHVSLSDKYTATSGTVFISGIEALVRLMLDQRRLDRARGLNTAAFVSGYEGSPLGGLDIELQRHPARQLLGHPSPRRRRRDRWRRPDLQVVHDPLVL
jgi:hypothetical protein